MAKVRWKIQSASIPETIVTPIWDGRFSYRRDRNEVYYAHEPTNDISLTGDDFALVEEVESGCEKITVTVERWCGDDWQTYWQGFFAKFNCRFNYGGIKVRNCLLDAKLTKDDKYDCLLKNWQTDVNIYGASAEITVKPFEGEYEIYTGVECNFCVPSGTPPAACATLADDWCMEQEILSFEADYPGGWPCDPSETLITRMFHRIIGVGTPTTPPPYDTGWTYLSGNDWWRCPDELADSNLVISPMTHGRRFNDVIEHLVDELDCGLTVRSHFFGINATHDAPPANDAYGFATAYCQDITIHRKSDVKRPNATNPSSQAVWTMKLKDLLDDFKKVFNVFWRIDGDDLILEHISYFEGAAGADYSEKPMPLQLKYEDDTPRVEKFYWQDKDLPGFFKAQPIVYDCGNGEKEYQSALFSTDVKGIQDELNQDVVADAGWVLISCRVVSSEYFANTLDDLVNGAFRWFNLHENLHRHNRYFETGTMNGVAASFLSVQKMREQPEFRVGICCDDGFDPANNITTLLGTGQVRTATENILQDTLELNLNY